MAGYVYLIGTPVFSWYKIGKSVSPEIRIQDLGILLPFKIEVIGIWKAENHHLLETSLHELYKNNRINGEWFRLKRREINSLFSWMPTHSRIFPSVNNPNSIFSKFSNIESDCPEGKKVYFSIKKNKTHFMTDKEREECRRIDMQKDVDKKERKAAKLKIVTEARNRYRNLTFPTGLHKQDMPSSL